MQTNIIIEDNSENTTIYNHAFTLSFSIETEKSCKSEKEEDYPSPQSIRVAILKRMASMDDVELMEVIGAPFDTFQV